eukprot:1160933-Pelagomonas_calceolata.AAC.3
MEAPLHHLARATPPRNRTKFLTHLPGLAARAANHLPPPRCCCCCTNKGAAVSSRTVQTLLMQGTPCTYKQPGAPARTAGARQRNSFFWWWGCLQQHILNLSNLNGSRVQALE